MLAISTIGSNRNRTEYTYEYYKKDLFCYFEYMADDPIHLKDLMSVASICLQPKLSDANANYSLCSKSQHDRENYFLYLTKVIELAIEKKCNNIIVWLAIPVENAFNTHIELCKKNNPKDKLQSLLDTHKKIVVPYIENACRFLFRICKKYPQINFCIPTARTFYEIPLFPNELEWIFDDVKCPNLKYWHNTGSSHVLEMLKITEQEGWLEAHGANMKGIHIEDVIDFETLFPPGMGEVNFKMIKPHIAEKTVKVFRISEQYGIFGVKTARDTLRL